MGTAKAMGSRAMGRPARDPMAPPLVEQDPLEVAMVRALPL